MIGLSSTKIFNWRKIILLFVIIDILFLPYFSLVSVSFSVPVIVIWALINGVAFSKEKEGAIVILIILLMLFSTLINPLYPGEVLSDTSFVTAFKRFVQYSVSLCLFVFFKDKFSSKDINLNEFLYFFVLFVFLLAVLFFLFPHQYATIKLTISPVDNHTRRYLMGTISPYRYNFLWTDPNNVAYAIVGVETYLLARGNLSSLKRIIVFCCSMFVILATSSAGGMISFVLSNFLLLMYYLLFELKVNSKIKLTSLIIIVLCVVIVFFVVYKTNFFEDVISPLVKSFKTRMSSYQNSSNITGGRLEDFMGAIKLLNPMMLIIGTGQEGFTTEIGHIYLIGLYGLFAYLGYMWLMFGKFGKQKYMDYIWVLPFFIGFTMNIGIGEYKWFAILIMMLSFCRYNNNLKGN